MNFLTQKDFDCLLTGSTFFGTGGGGSPILSRKIYQNIVKAKQKLEIKKLDQCQSDDLFITVFAVGGLNQARLPNKQIKKGLKLLQQLLKLPIKGIIPVEIGPLSVATAANIATKLRLPLIDADFVGGRSSPEVFLETISLFKLKRTPLVVVNSKDDLAILSTSTDFRFEEDFLRTFSSISKETAYVLGYPITQKTAMKCLSVKTVSQAIKTGQEILKKRLVGKLLFQGKITQIQEINLEGFTSKIISIKNSQNIGKLYLKNESLIFWVNDRPVLTCPDLIILLDQNNRPIYNLDLKLNQSVKMVGYPAQPLWRSKKGLKLFNPKLFGYNVKQRLL